MRKILIVILLGLTACSSDGDTPNQQGTEQEQPSENHAESDQESNQAFQSEAETIAEDLDVPWDIETAGQLLIISERPGAIVKIENGEATRKQVRLENDLADAAEAGLLGIAVPSSYQENGQIFAYYSYSSANGVFQRIAALKENQDEWVETGTLVDHIPGGSFHQGGRIEIGPDGKLYATTGDATQPALAQDLNSLAGKILRINMDGTVPRDNPFEGSLVYSYGHRNPQGLAWNDESQLYATEHGDQAHDEVNKIEPGKNYGWPEIEGDTETEGMVIPLAHSGNDTWAPSGMAFMEGDFYFGSLRGAAVRQFQPENSAVSVLIDGFGRIRDVAATAEGLYFITNNTDGRGSPVEEDDRLLLLRKEDS